MATAEDQHDQNEVDEVQDDQQGGDEQEAERKAGETPENQPQDDEPEDESIVVSIDGEAPPPEEEVKAAPAWVKDLRKEHREAQRRIRELEAERAAGAQAVQQAPALGEKPTLAACDYDESEYESKLQAWHQKKSEVEAAQRAVKDQEAREQQEWANQLTAHETQKKALKVPDYDEAEDVVLGTFSPVQQAILVKGASNSALLAYAIGKNPAKAKALAAIKDPVKFAFELGRLETQVKTAPKKTAPAPETRVRASAPVSGAVDSKLAKLMEEAERTGDRTKVAAYHRERARQSA